MIDPESPRNSPPRPAIRIEKLWFQYPDGRPALRGVDLVVEPGESVALVGPNGAGKSTLLLHLNGVLPGSGRTRVSHAHGGSSDSVQTPPKPGPSVWIDGLAVDSKNVREVRRRVGLVFQDPDDQLFSTSVIEDVAFGPLNLGMSKTEAKRVALQALEQVDLVEASGRSPHHLSFGERKRVCLAGVLACGPTVLVLDEPTANLDPRGRRRFLGLIAGLTSTKLIATHDLEMVLELCERTVVLDGGCVVADGPTRFLLDDAGLLESHGLERPYSLRRSSPS